MRLCLGLGLAPLIVRKNVTVPSVVKARRAGAGTLLFRIERSGQPRADGGPARVNPDPFPNRPVAGEARIQMILFRVKTENPLPLQLLRIPPKPTKLSVDHPPAPPHVPAPPLSVRARARRSQAAAPHPHSQGSLCPVSVFASRISLLIGRAGDAYLYRPGGPPPTHALGLGPPLTASRSALRAVNLRFFRICCISIHVLDFASA